jgi:hypothetical protein
LVEQKRDRALPLTDVLTDPGMPDAIQKAGPGENPMPNILK